MTRAQDHLGLIDAIVYGDVFDCAITFEELHRYSLVRVSPEELTSRLAGPVLSQLFGERGGYYFLAGRDHLASERVDRRRRALTMRRRALRVARILQYLPFVRGLLLTGSVAADDATEEADLDLLIIIAKQRLALAFTVLAPISRLLSRRVFCPNYYLTENHLLMQRRDYYVAREIVQAEHVAGPGGDLWSSNGWVVDFFPNAQARSLPARALPGGRLLQGLLESPFRGKFGDWLERRAQRLVQARLAAHFAHHGRTVPTTVIECLEANIELRFHGDPRIDRSLHRYAERRAEIARIINTLIGDQPETAVEFA